MAPKACEHCGSPLSGRQRFWCSEFCRRHGRRELHGLLDPCKAGWYMIDGKAHAAKVMAGGTVVLVCGSRNKRRIARSVESLGLTPYFDRLDKCGHCQTIMR